MDTTISTPVLKTEKDGICTLTLNRPKNFNALSLEMLEVLLDMFKYIASSEHIKVVILAAEGKAFCAGHDLKEMREHRTKTFGDALFTKCSELMLAIHHLPQPVIAKVQGIATAAGCQLVATCDLAIAATTARFAVSGINYGLFCSTPSVALSRNVGTKKSLELLLTGDFLSAEDAHTEGLINQVVPIAELDSFTQQLAEKIAAQSSEAIRLGKNMFYKQLAMDLPSAYDYATERIVSNMLTADCEEGLNAFVEKRKPVWK